MQAADELTEAGEPDTDYESSDEQQEGQLVGMGQGISEQEGGQPVGMGLDTAEQGEAGRQDRAPDEDAYSHQPDTAQGPRCLRNLLCVKPARHRGRCKLQRGGPSDPDPGGEGGASGGAEGVAPGGEQIDEIAATMGIVGEMIDGQGSAPSPTIGQEGVGGQCQRSAACTKPAGHAGFCNNRTSHPAGRGGPVNKPCKPRDGGADRTRTWGLIAFACGCGYLAPLRELVGAEGCTSAHEYLMELWRGRSFRDHMSTLLPLPGDQGDLVAGHPYIVAYDIGCIFRRFVNNPGRVGMESPLAAELRDPTAVSIVGRSRLCDATALPRMCDAAALPLLCFISCC